MSSFLSDEALKRALAAYREEILQDIPPQEDLEELTFSPRFARRMRRLLAAAPRRGLGVGKRRVAALLLTALVAGSCLLSVEAIRAPIIAFFLHIRQIDTGIEFRSDGGQASVPQWIETKYLPSFQPEGFVLEDTFDEESIFDLFYQRDQDFYSWTQVTVGNILYLNTEGVELEQFDFEGVHYFYYSNLGSQQFVWQEKGYAFSCAGTISKELLWEIIRSAEQEK